MEHDITDGQSALLCGNLTHGNCLEEDQRDEGHTNRRVPERHHLAEDNAMQPGLETE